MWKESIFHQHQITNGNGRASLSGCLAPTVNAPQGTPRHGSACRWNLGFAGRLSYLKEKKSFCWENHVNSTVQEPRTDMMKKNFMILLKPQAGFCFLFFHVNHDFILFQPSVQEACCLLWILELHLLSICIEMLCPMFRYPCGASQKAARIQAIADVREHRICPLTCPARSPS